MYKLGTWIVHPQKFLIECDGEELKLKPLIMKLLLLFIESDGVAISKDELLENCWKGRVVSDDAIRQAIKDLRIALNSNNDDIEYIQTIRKHGYRLLPEVETITIDKETPSSNFFIKNRKVFIYFIIIFIIFFLLTAIYQNSSVHISKDSTVITYDQKREMAYDKSVKGWDSYTVIKPDHYFGESVLIRDEKQNLIHTILPSNVKGHVDNSKFSPNGQLLVYLDFSPENCKIRIINVKTGDRVHSIDCQKGDYYIALDWHSDNELLYSTSASNSLPLELRLYNIKTREQKQLTSPSKGGRGDYFVNSCNESNYVILRNMDFITTQIISYNPTSGQEQLITDIPYSVISVDWLSNCESIAIYLEEKGLYAISMDDSRLTPINENIRNVQSIRIVKEHLYLSQGMLFNKSIISLNVENNLSTAVVIESNGTNVRFIKSPIADRFVFLSTRTGRMQVWLYDNKKLTQLSEFENAIIVNELVWSNDGESIFLVEGVNTWTIEINSLNKTKIESISTSINSLIIINEDEWLYSSYENNLWQGYLWNVKTQDREVISNLTIKAFKKNKKNDIFFRTQDDDIYQYNNDDSSYEKITSINALCNDWTIEDSVVYCLDDEGLKKKSFTQDKMDVIYQATGTGQRFSLEDEHKFYLERTNSGKIDIHQYTLINTIF